MQLCQSCLDAYGHLPPDENIPIWLSIPKAGRFRRKNRRSLSVSRVLYERLKAWSETTGNSMSYLVEKLTNQHLDSGAQEPDWESRAHLSANKVDVATVDEAAKEAGESRSKYMMKAALMRIEKESK